QGMSDSDPAALYSYAASQLNAYDLAYIHTMEPLPGHMLAGKGPRVTPVIRKIYQGVLMTNGGYDAQTGAAAINNDETDLIAYGVPFLANPDLVTRYRLGAPLNTPDYDTFYSHGPEGYADYPTWDETAPQKMGASSQ
ncbi:MAG: alkene reductase, partial [Pseudomonadales bacterium]|nr:alkene reductase [Pseudomonadales bacterium]